MKRIYMCFAIICMLAACKDQGRQSSEAGKTPDAGAPNKFENPTETYVGTVKGVPIIFEHKNFTQYRLTEGDVVTQGNLNTERGFQDDEDATVFILDFDKLQDAQKYIVRFSNGQCVLLDAQRNVLPGANLTKRSPHQ